MTSEAGYDEGFLKTVLPLPRFSNFLRESIVPIETGKNPLYRDYVHYSVATSKFKRWPVVTALNVRQGKWPKTDHGSWSKDSVVGKEHQLGPEYFDHNRWDKGHVASRAGAAWGDQTEAVDASDSTMYYSNAALQLDTFNRGEWKDLETWIREMPVLDGKVSVFSGPVSGLDPMFVVPRRQQEPDEEKYPAEVPAAFFKVFCYHNLEGALEVRAFFLPQDKDAVRKWSDRHFEDILATKIREFGLPAGENVDDEKFKEWRREAKREWGGAQLINNQIYQTSVAEIEQLTGLRFPPEIAEANPLLYHDNDEAQQQLNIKNFPEHIPINSHEDFVALKTTKRWIEDDEVDVFIMAAHPKPRRGQSKWVSIQNLEPETLDLSGWVLREKNGNQVELQGKVQPGHSLLLKGQKLGEIDLGDRANILTLWNKDENRVDRVRYTSREANSRRAVIFRMRISDI